MAGLTYSSDFPTTVGAYDQSHGGLTDGYVSKLDLSSGSAVEGTPGPSAFSGPLLRSNVPNPFNPKTTIGFHLPEAGPVSLVVFDVGGRRVRGLLEGWLPAGEHAVAWDGLDDSGRSLPSGLYFYRLRTEGFEGVQKMVLVR